MRAILHNRRPEWSDSEAQGIHTLLDRMVTAYLYGMPEVGMTDDGRLGWTEAAKVRGKVAAGETLAPFATGIVELTNEVAVNLRDRLVMQALKRQLKKARKAGNLA